MLTRYISKIVTALFIVSLLLGAENSFAQKKRWEKILPDHVKIQYGGGMGFISIGAGYSNRNQKLEGDIYYGYLPENIGGVTIHSISGKLNWIPLTPTRIKKFLIEPLVTGLLLNYSFGDQYFSFDPPNYPYNYYSFPTSIHAAVFFGSRIGFKRATFYYEILGFDRDIMSLAANPKSLHLTDVFTISAGLKINLK